MNILRKYKLSILNMNTLSINQRKIINFFDSHLFNLLKKESIDKTYLGYFKNDDIIMQYDIANQILWVRWKDIWSVFANDLNVDYTDIEIYMKKMFEFHYKLNVENVKVIECKYLEMIQKHYVE